MKNTTRFFRFKSFFSKQIALMVFILLIGIYANGAARYWVGGSSNTWNNTGSWAASSGGANGQTVPGNGDDVYFDNSTGNANPTVTLANAIATLNSLNFTSSNVTFAGAFAITTTSMMMSSSQVVFVNNITVNSSLNMSTGVNTITITTASNGNGLTLGTGGAFTLTGHSATNYFDAGNGNAYYTFNTTSALTVYFNNSNALGNINITKGAITLGSNLNTSRVNLSSTNSETLVVNGNSLTINGNGSSVFTSNANGGLIDASATNSIVNINTANTSVLNTTGNIFASGKTVNQLIFNSTGNVFNLPQAITVNTLVLTAGTINNSTNNVTIAAGGSITRAAGILAAAPILAGSTTVTANNGSSTITAGNELQNNGGAGSISSLTVNSGETYVLNASGISSYSLSGGNGYSSTYIPSVSFTVPQATGSSVTATGTAFVPSATVASIGITNTGSGYTTGPTAYITPPNVAAIPTWAVSTAYYANEVITNGSNTYICTVGGTSASSGGGPTSTTSSSAITDGGVTWYYVSNWSGSTTYSNGNGYTINTAYVKTTNNIIYQLSTIGAAAAGTGPTGTGSAIVDNGAKWNYISALGSPAAWQPSHAYSAGNIVSYTTAAGSVYYYYCSASTGNSNSSAPATFTTPTLTLANSITDNVVTWYYIGNWIPSTNYNTTAANTYVINGTNVYQLNTTGFSAGPTGIAANTTDGAAKWNYITSFGSVWAATTTYIAGTVVSNSSKLYICTTGGISASSGGPTVASGTTIDNSIKWTFLSSSAFSQATATPAIPSNSLTIGSVSVAGTLEFPNLTSTLTLNVTGNVGFTGTGAFVSTNIANTVNHIFNIGGDITNSGSGSLVFTGGGTTKAVDVNLNGSSNQSLATATFNNLNVINNASNSGTNTVNVNGNIASSGLLTIGNASTSGSVTVNNGYSLTLNGGLTLSNSTTNIGKLITTTSLSSGAATNGGGSNGTVIFGAGTFTFNSGSTITNNGYLKNTIASTITPTTLTIGSYAVYEHALNGGTIPTATWPSTSTLSVTAITSTGPSGLGQSLGNVTWNCTGQTTNVTCATNFVAAGAVTVSNTGTSGNAKYLQLANSATTVTIGGGLTVGGGTYAKVDLSNTASSAVTITGGVTISSNGTLQSSATCTLSATGAWSNSGTFTQANTTVTFNGSGTSGSPQTITGATTFNVLNISSGFVQLNTASTAGGATNISVGATFATGVTFAANAAVSCLGSFQLNAGSWATGSGTWNYSTTGTLIFNNTSSYGVNSGDVFWPTSNGPINVTILQGGLTLNSGTNRTVTGLFQTSAAVTQSSASLTLSGTCQINTGGSFTNTPTYSGSLLLIYNTGGTFGRSFEWSNPASGSVGAGSPASVQMSGSTTLNYPNGAAASPAATLTGYLTVDAGSALDMDWGTPGTSTGALTVSGAVTISGNLSLGNKVGGDLYVGGNFANSGTFTHNSRAVFINGSSNSTAQTISGTFNGSGTTNCIPYLTIATTGTAGVSLNTPVTVTTSLTLTSGIVTTTSTNLLTVAGTISGGSSTTYISGPLAWTFSATSGTYTFPVGTASGYYKFILGTPNTNGANTTTVQAFSTGSSTGGTVDGTLSSVGSEYWTVTTSSAYTSLGSVTLTTNTGTITASSVVAQGNGTSYTTENTAAGGSANTVTNTGSLAVGTTEYYAVGALPTFSMGTIVPTAISGVTQSNATGYYGQTVTVNGFGFLSPTPTLTIGGTSVSINVTSNTALTFVVPTTVSSGTLQLSQSGTNLTASFTVLGFISIADGDWNTSSTWSSNMGNFVPTASSTVTVNNVLTVSSTTTNAPSTITINNTKSLAVNAGGSLTGTTITNNGTLSTASTGVLTATTLTNNGTLSQASGGTLAIASGGTLTNSGTFNNATGTAGTINFLEGTPTFSGITNFFNVSIGGGVNFSGTTINGTLQINVGGYVNTTAPAYASGSTLKYYSGTTYGRGTEWTASSGTIGTTAGYPYSVQVSNNTTLNYTGWSSGTGYVVPALAIAGNLTVDAGSSFYMDYGTTNLASYSGGLTVGGLVLQNGNLSLGYLTGGDIYVAGNWTNTGTFTPNSRAVYFNGSTNCTVNNGSSSFDYLLVSKSAGANTVTLAANATVNQDLTLTTGKLDYSTYTLTLGGNIAVTSGTIVTASAGNITMTGNGKSIPALTLGNLTINGSTNKVSATGTLTFAIGSTLNIASGDTLDMGTNTLAATVGNFNNSGAGAIKIGGTLPYSYTTPYTWSGWMIFTSATSYYTIYPANYNNIDIDYSTGASRNLDAGSGVGTGTFSIAGTMKWSGTGNIAANKTTFSFGASASVPSGITFYNVSFNGSAAPTISGGTGTSILNIGNTFSPGSATSISAGTINFSTVSGGGVTEGNQTIPAFNYNNLTIGGARTTNNVILASSGTIGVAGAFSYSATYTSGSLITTGSTINFNGSGQTIPAFTYNNLTNTSTGTSTLGGTVTVNGNLNNSSGTLACSSYTLNIAGNFTNSGTFTAGTGTVNLNGTTTQTIPSGLTFNKLAISNANVTIPTVLNVSGLLTTDPGTGNTLLQPVNTTINGSGGLTVNSGTFSIAGTTSTLASNTASSNNAVFNLTGGTPTITSTLAIGGYFYCSTTTVYTMNSGYGFTVASNGVYEAANASPTLPVATAWNSNSNLYLTGIVGGNPSNIGQTFGNVVWNSTSQTGNLVPSGFSNIAGAFIILNTGSGSVRLNNTTNSYGSLQIGGSATINGSTVNSTAASLNVGYSTAGATTVSGSVTIGSNGTLAAGTSGTSISLSGNWTNNGGTFTQANTTVNFNNTSASQTINGTAASQTFNTLTLGNTGQTLSVGGSTTAITTSTLTINSGTFTAPATLTVSGSLSNSGTLTAGSVINITGNWTNSGTFNANSGTVNLTGTTQTISGSTTFYNLTKSVATATTLTLAGGQTQTVTDTLTLNGASGQLLTVASSTAPSIASINPTTAVVSYCSISNITNSNTTPVNATASTNGSNNTNIFFNTYSWTGATSTDYTASTNWTPNRTIVTTADILQFNNNATNLVTNVPTQTIYQLFISGTNTIANLQTGASNNTLTIAGDNNTSTYDLTVASNCQLNLTNSTNITSASTSQFTIKLGTNATGDINGSILIDNAPMVFNAVSNSGARIDFESGSAFTNGSNITNQNNSYCYPFTQTNPTDQARIVFKSGSYFYNNGGNSPLLPVASGAVQGVNFQSGSWYVHGQAGLSNTAFATDNVTYANFKWNVNSTGSYANGLTGANVLTFDSIYVAQGSFNLTFGTGITSNTININKGINVVSGSSLGIGYLAGITTNINFEGTTTQYINGNGSVNLGNTSAASTTNAVAVNFNNTSGVILQSTLTNCSTNPTYTIGTGASFDASATNATLNFVQQASLTLPSALGTTIGNLSTTIGSTNTLSLGAATAINGNLTITTGILDVTSANSYPLSVAGNFVNNGTFSAQTGTVTFNGTSTISGSSTTSFNNVTISGSLTGKSAATFNVAGNWVNNGTYIHNSGTVNFNGTTTVSGSAITTFNNLTIAASSTLTGHSTNMNIAGTFTNSSTFNHNNGTVTFTGTSTINNNNTFYNLTTSGTGTTTFGNVTTSIANNLSVGDGTTVSIPNGTFAVTGTTTIGGGTSGTILFTNSSGSRTFGGLFTLNAGSTWTNSGNAAVSLNGGLTIAGAGVTFTAGTNTTSIVGGLTTNGAFTASTGTISFSGTSSIAGSVAPSFNNFTISSGTLTSSSGNINVAGTFTSTGTFTHNSGTVTFNGGSSQSISSPVTFYNLTTTGSGTAVSIGNNTTNINGALNIGDGTSFTIVAATVTVTGTTTIGSGSGSTAKLITSNTSGTRTFIGAVSVNSNGWFNNTAGSSDIFQGGITNNGTFDGTTSAYSYTFNTNSQSISGTGTFGNIVNLIVTGTGIVLTNNVSLTVTNVLSGTGGLTQGSSSTLNLGATPTVTALIASATGNTVNFNGSGAQTIPAASYYNLTISGTRTTNNVTLVSGGTINIAGTYSNTVSFAGGSLVSTNNTINLNGTSNQSIDGSTFNNLTINNNAGVTLNGNVTVGGTLTLTAGRVTTGSNTLSVTSTSVGAVTATTSFGTAAYINGTLIRSVISANSNYVFPVGQYSSSTDYYYPFTLNTNTASGTVNVTVNASKGSAGGSADGTTVATVSPNEYWQATTSSTLTGTVSLGTAAIGSYTIIGTSTTLAGTYSSLSGLASGTTISNSSSVSIPTSSAYFVVATSAIAPPTITSITSCVPTTATNSFYARDTITINGTGFISTSAVTVGGQAATILDNTGVPTVLKVLVSSSASTNAITVSNVGGATSFNGTFIAGYVSRYTGSYGTGSTWLGGSVPASNANITICTTVTMASTTSGLQNLTVNSGATLTCNNIGMNYITGAVITNNGTITSSNTMTFAGTLTVAGSSTTQFSSITLNGLTTFTTAPLINGTITLNSGSSIATHAPTYGSSSIITYNSGTTVSPGIEWTAGATSGAGVPYRVNVNNGNTLNLSSGTYTVLSLLAAYGNISSTGGSLNLSNAAMWFAGSAAQTINIGTAQPNVLSISIANATGTTLQSNITITSGISFQNGVLTTSASNLLTIASSVASGSFKTSSSSYINGPLARIITNTTRDTFPIGIGGVYQPITFAYASTPFSAETVTITPSSSIPGTTPSNVSTVQFGTTSWNVTQSATGYAYTLGIGNGGVSNTSGGSVAIAKREGSGSYATTATTYTTTPYYIYTSSSAFSTSNTSNDIFLAETNIPLTITGAVVNNKSYDGTTAASLSTVGTLSGILSGDAVSIASSSVTFSSKNVGTGISISANYTITGTNAGAYSVTQPSLVANINALGLTITANDQSKNYGTSLSSTSTQFTSSGLLSGETIGTVSLNYSGGGAASAAAGTYSIIPSNPVASSGNPFSASNYNITYVDGTLTVNVGSHGIWTGIASTSYNNVLNWADGQVPSAGDNIIINTGATYYPVIVSNDTIGSIVIASGTTLGLGGDTLTINGEIGGSGTLTSTAASSLILNGATGTINFTSGGNTIQNLTLNTGASATLGTQTLIASDINAGTVTIGNGATLNTGGNLVLLSDSLGTASIAQLQGTLSGNVTVQRYISAKTARVFTMVGSPVTESIQNAWQQQVYITGVGSGGAVCSTPNSNGFDVTQTNTPSMYTYDSVQVSGSRWISVPNTSSNLTPGVGYKMNIRGDRNLGSCVNELSSNSPAPPTAVTLSATGTVDTGNVVVALHDPLTHLYSLVANPYPSTMSFTNLYLENEGNINYNMWTFSPFGNGNYTTFSGGIVTNAASGYGGLGASPDNIASGQAFFVQAANPIATSASITFQESDKVNQVLPNTQYFGAAINKLLRVGLKTSTNSNLDEIVVRFKANGSPAYNPKVDAASLNAGSQVLVALKANNKVAIATYPDDTNADTALLGVSSTSIGTFRLVFSDYAGIDASRSITLIDNFLGTTQDVRANQVYDFNVTSNTASQGNNRFVVVFGTENPLPVSFTNVTATKNNTGVAVNWSVANQLNIANYEVERSTDGSTFTSIATTKATIASSYSVEDKNIPTTANTLYYRIKSIGDDGSFKYSNVASLKLSINNYQLSIFPNPVQDKLNITIGGATNGTYAVRILTVAGKEIMNRGGVAANGNTIKLDASNLAGGVYMLELTDASGNKQLEKFVKD